MVPQLESANFVGGGLVITRHPGVFLDAAPSLTPLAQPVTGPAACAPKCLPHLFSALHRSSAFLSSTGREAPTWLPFLQSDPLQFISQPQRPRETWIQPWSTLIRTYLVTAKCLPFVQSPWPTRRLLPVFLSPLSPLPLIETHRQYLRVVAPSALCCFLWLCCPSLVHLENSCFSFKTQLQCRLFCEFFLSTPRRLAFPSHRPPYRFVLHTKCQQSCLPLPQMVSSKEQEYAFISHT